jgi:hypothetical protein
MAKFRIEYEKTSLRACFVDADNAMEAKQKFFDWEDVTEDREEYGMDEKIVDIYED